AYGPGGQINPNRCRCKWRRFRRRRKVRRCAVRVPRTTSESRTRMLNKLLIALGVLLVLVIAAILIGPGFVDWNSYKREITAKVEEATGRRLESLGDISLSLLPPTLSAEGVRFANMAGGSAPNMAALDALNIRIAP